MHHPASPAIVGSSLHEGTPSTASTGLSAPLQLFRGDAGAAEGTHAGSEKWPCTSEGKNASSMALLLSNGGHLPLLV